MSASEEGVSRATVALQSAYVFAKACHMTKRPCEVKFFNHAIVTAKEYTKIADPEKFEDKAQIFNDEEVDGQKGKLEWNCDHKAIDAATKSLLKRPEKNKILVVLSDGSPAPCIDCRTSRGGASDLRDAIATAEKSGIHIHGVGVQYDCTPFYKNSIKCTTVAEVGDTFAKLFKDLTK